MIGAVPVARIPHARGLATSPPSRSRQLLERGMVTAEYAVGILAAIAFALVLLGIFHDSSMRQALLHYVLSLINQLSSYIR